MSDPVLAEGAVVAVSRSEGDLIGVLRLAAVRPLLGRDTSQTTSDVVRVLSALEGHRDCRFVIQTVAFAQPLEPEKGRIEVAIFVVTEASEGATQPDRLAEVLDDVCDLLGALPEYWQFEQVHDEAEISALLDPIPASSFAEIARREEPCQPGTWTQGVGFEVDPGRNIELSRLWTMWTLGPSARSLDRLYAVLLAQEAPVVIRTILRPTRLTSEERAGIERIVLDEGPATPGLRLASVRTIESLLYLRPLFEVRTLVASTEPLSGALLSTLGYAVSEPAQHEASLAPVLRGGCSIVRDRLHAPEGVLADAFHRLEVGAPVPGLAPEGLGRLRRLMGPWEAACVTCLPIAGPETLPGITVNQIPVLRAPVHMLPRSGSVIGTIESSRVQLRVDETERMRHLYVSGQTGTGKSTLLLNMALKDIERGSGVAVIDPHGDLVAALLERVPGHRAEDVVLVDPGNTDRVVGVNLLEAESPLQAEYITAELCNMFYALFDPMRQGIVGPRYETWLRQAAALLMANQHRYPSSFLDIPTLFVDKAVRDCLLDGIEDPILNEFWRGEMAQTSDYHRSEILGWFRSKFEIFRTSGLVRAMLGQSRSTISFTEILDEGKILLVNLSKGTLGEYNSRLLGHVIFMRLWGATLERSAVPEEERTPFFVFIDEFQNVTSESLPTVLSEARKFKVSLTLANQFFDQLRSETRQAIAGNVGTSMMFRVGPDDARRFQEWLGGAVSTDALCSLPNHTAVASLTAHGVPLDPVIFTTLPPPPGDRGAGAAVREASLRRWGIDAADAQRDFFNRWAGIPNSLASKVIGPPGVSEAPPAPPSPPPRPPSTFLDGWLTKKASLTMAAATEPDAHDSDDPIDEN